MSVKVPTKRRGRKEVVTMAKVPAYHSAKAGTKVHHNNNKCTEGNNIETYNLRSGTGGLPLCDHCKRLA
jgi:hypothetical protein